jgi:hypothetical protein
MLWWHVGGWSRLLEQPFAELELGSAAVLAGLDMAEMSCSTTGPAATPAILKRTILAARKSKATKIAIKDAVDPLSQDQLDRISFAEQLNSVPDICPVLTAFLKAKEIGGGSSWHASFTKVTKLDPGAALPPLDLAMQAYRERLLLRALD